MIATKTREIGMLMSAPMCAALKDRRKTQTRRLIRGVFQFEAIDLRDGQRKLLDCIKDWDGLPSALYLDPENWEIAPYQPGDTLRFLSSWAVPQKFDGVKPTELPRRVRMWTHFDGEKPKWAGVTRPGRFLPTKLRRYLPSAVVERVRAQRLQEITEEDARSEGFPLPEGMAARITVRQLNGHVQRNKGRVWDFTGLDGFRRLWEALHGAGSWELNSWIWAVSWAEVVFGGAG